MKIQRLITFLAMYVLSACGLAVHAQQAHLPNTLSLGLGQGVTFYEAADVLALFADYQRKLGTDVSVFVDLGYVGGKIQSEGRSSGSGGSGQSGWNNAWVYRYNEWAVLSDVGMMLHFMPPEKAVQLSLGAGVSHAFVGLHYAPDLLIERGVIVRANYTTHRASSWLYMARVALDVRISGPISAGLQVQGRANFNNVSVLERTTLYSDGFFSSGFSSTTSGIRSNYDLQARIRYAF